MDRVPEKVLENVLSNLSVMDLFRLQVVSKAFKESCRRSLKSRQKLIVCETLPDNDRENWIVYKCMGIVFLERIRACSPGDAIRPELFEFNSSAILNRMTGLKELYIVDYVVPNRILNLIFKRCCRIEYMYVSTDVLEFIPENELTLKYLCGWLRVNPLLSIMDKSPALQGLGINVAFEGIPHRNQEYEELLPTLLTKLPFGLKWFKIVLEADNLSSLFCSEAMKTLQDLSIDTYNSATDLPMFSAPELVKFEYKSSNGIPDEILRSLAMYSTKLKEVRLIVRDRTGGQTVYFPLRGLEKVYIYDPSEEVIETLCRNNRNLQSIELEYGNGDLTRGLSTERKQTSHGNSYL